MQPTIEAHGLTKHYGKTQALDGLDLIAERGQVVAVLGPNGAGKTTFVRTVATLLRPDEGTLRVAGHRRPHRARSGPPRHRPGGAVRRRRAGDDRAREPCHGRPPLRAGPARGQGQRRRRARPTRARRRGRTPRAHVLGRDAPPARPRRQPGRGTPAPAARRAHDRTRPSQPNRAVGGDPRPRRDRDRRPARRPSTWTRPTSSPTRS